MYQSLFVGHRQRHADGGSDLGHTLRGESAFGADEGAQVLALDELHHHEVGVTVLTPVVDGDDVGVGQGSGGLRLAPKPLYEPWILGELPMQGLDGDAASQNAVLGDPHVGHAAASEMRDEGVAIREDARGFH